mgnify:CR=1 FL=1
MIRKKLMVKSKHLNQKQLKPCLVLLKVIGQLMVVLKQACVILH